VLTQIDGPTDGPFEQANRWDENTRESSLAAAHATNLPAPLGYGPQYRDKKNTPHITVARSRVNDTITSKVLNVALAFFTQQSICDIFNLRHSMLSFW
jgi:2'-5' RNA ligase